jgi:type II secretory pathway component GspD/PulD (secretin)
MIFSKTRRVSRISVNALLAAMIAMAATAASADPEDDGLRFSRTASKTLDTLAMRAGGPTERIEIQSTRDNIDYTVKTYTLKHANAAEVYELILHAVSLEGGFVDRVSPGSVVDIDAGTLDAVPKNEGDSYLIVTAPDWMFKSLDEAIAALDRPGIDVAYWGTGATYYKPKHILASELAALIGASSASSTIVLAPDDVRNVLYIDDIPSFFPCDMAAIKAYDVPKPQIETRVRIYQIDESNAKDVGLDWYAWKEAIGGEGFTATWAADPGSYDLDLTSFAGSLTLSPQAATEFLNYLATNGNAKVVTDSRMTQVNSIPASISSSVDIPYIVHRNAEEELQSITDAVLEFAEGVTVDMTPRIADEIEIAVSASVSSLIGYTPTQNVPILSKSSVDTSVLLAPGMPAVLGGLTKKSMVSERGGIPVLKDIPVIRVLTSRVIEREVSSQIIITIELEKAPAGIRPDLATLEALPL